MKKVSIWIIVVAVAAIFVGTTSYLWVRANRYEYIAPKRGKMVEAIYGLGKVKAERKYEVKVGVITTVQRVYVQEGETVVKGAPLIKFKDTAVFRAPFSGVVTSVNFNEAETVVPQAVSLKLQDLKNNYIEVALEQEGALRVKRGQRVEVLFETLRGKKYKGEVEALYPKEDEFLAHIHVPKLPENVLPGMTADISIIVSEREDALLVPLSSVVEGKVLLKREGEKLKLPVEVGGVGGQWVEILSHNIKLTDKVLIKKSATESP